MSSFYLFYFFIFQILFLFLKFLLSVLAAYLRNKLRAVISHTYLHSKQLSKETLEPTNDNHKNYNNTGSIRPTGDSLDWVLLA